MNKATFLTELAHGCTRGEKTISVKVLLKLIPGDYNIDFQLIVLHTSYSSSIDVGTHPSVFLFPLGSSFVKASLHLTPLDGSLY